MSLRGKTWSVDAALMLALFLAVQAFVSGLSIGARADTLGPDTGVICGALGATSGPGSPGSTDRVHLLDCCTLGCSMVGGAAAPEPLFAVQRTAPTDIPAVAIAEAHQPGRFELSPLHSRAPPRA